MSTPGNHTFPVVSSSDVYRGRILGLRADEVRMPDGSVGRREVVEHLGAVAVCALDADGAVTLIRQYRHPLRDRLWELPAGLLDIEGEEPVAAAQRELAEETGLAARHWETLVDVASSPGFTDEVMRVFLARELSDVERSVQGDEEADLVTTRVPLDEAVRMALLGELVNGATVSGVLAAHVAVSGSVPVRPPGTSWPHRPTAFAARNH